MSFQKTRLGRDKGSECVVEVWLRVAEKKRGKEQREPELRKNKGKRKAKMIQQWE